MNQLVPFPAMRIRRDKKFLTWHLPVTSHDEFKRRRHIFRLAMALTSQYCAASGGCGTDVVFTDHQVSDWGGRYAPDYGKGLPTVAPGDVLDEAMAAFGNFAERAAHGTMFTQGDQVEHLTYGWPCVVIGYGWPVAGEYLVEATMVDGRVFSLPVHPGLLRKPKRREQDPPPAA